MKTLRVITYENLAPQKGITFCRVHLRRLIKRGDFPAPITLGTARIAWIESEVDAWLEQRRKARDEAAEQSAAA